MACIYIVYIDKQLSIFCVVSELLLVRSVSRRRNYRP